MLIFLYGSDGYRLKESVGAVVDSYQKKHKSGINLYRFDLSSDKNYNDLASAVKSVSFFDEVKLVIVKNIFDNKIYADNLSDLIKDFNLDKIKDVALVFVEDKTQKDLEKKNSGLFSLLGSKSGLIRNIEYLSGTKLLNWVKVKFEENGHNTSSAVANLLIDAVGNESYALANEVEKLGNYKKGAIITEKDINLLVGHKENNNIFDLVDSVGNRDKARSFEMMYRLLNEGRDGHYLLSMLVYHFENLLSVSGGSTPNGMHPFVARKSASQACKFTKEDLLSKFNYLAELDVSSKSGLINLEDSLYNFVLA